MAVTTNLALPVVAADSPVRVGGVTSEGCAARGSCVQKVEPTPSGRMMAVTTRVTVLVTVLSVSRLPGCRPNRAAVCGVTATATVPVGSVRPG
jgi:hypothetical protein